MKSFDDFKIFVLHPGHTTIVKGMVQCTVDLNGKTALITGANCGIGFETALDLASRGARVIMACRDVTRAEDAKAKVISITMYFHYVFNLQPNIKNEWVFI